METLANNYSHIKGWGIDADPKNDPTYPMRNRAGEDTKSYDWQRPTQQPIDIEVHHSTERPNVSAVFGTSVPPSGLSGMLRRYAFKHPENQYGRWLPMLLADRINVVEGIIEDFKTGKVPNIIAEKGMKADWQHNRSGVMKKAAVAAFLVAAVVAWNMGKKSRD
ncbi:hypothetical protein EFA69_06745 [Rufibacter immobilis]|uniref:Uncharacterized protein n=1 Tax=Rufibacter immobilis TaxID=1348778 RepID=A0A3M9MZ20_9BACT|nr:hypothetical protein [Rufibacter immobilis]RNI30799.1 hypothetical protein EFA69_06745 [Rufibacter immobilis]